MLPACKLSSDKLGVLMAVVLFLSTTLANAAAGIEKSVIGKWKITAPRDGAEITSLDEREAQQLVGKIFDIRRDKIVFGARDCGPSEFEAKHVDVRLFFREEFRASPENLGLPNPVTAVDLSCTTVFIKTPNKLLIFWDGWFFDAVRIR